MAIRFLAALVLALSLCAQSEPWTSTDVIQPDDLARRLKGNPAAPPRILQVGFAVLYKGRHIPGAVYAGPGSKDEGLEALKQAVANIPKDRLIVLYCGCCPWDKCPNVKPAFTLLHGMGFKQVKVMEVPTNFAKDWVDKGLPVDPPVAAAP